MSCPFGLWPPSTLTFFLQHPDGLLRFLLLVLQQTLQVLHLSVLAFQNLNHKAHAHARTRHQHAHTHTDTHTHLWKVRLKPRLLSTDWLPLLPPLQLSLLIGRGVRCKPAVIGWTASGCV